MIRLWLLLLGAQAALVLAGAAFAEPSAPAVEILLGNSVASLNGPWRFHTGDDPDWADPAFDDSSWELMDLTPDTPDTHDDDQGITRYVPGWNTKGHRGYWGYAWYRLRLTVQAPPGVRLALTGPPLVDSAYEIFLDGRRLGGTGQLVGGNPTTLSVQPRLFPLAIAPSGPHFIAIRVWSSEGVVAAPLAGGVHVAPQLGEARAIDAQYQVQWTQTFKAFIVDATEGVLFLLLAAAALGLRSFDPPDRSYIWLAAMLAAIGILWLNQATYGWGRFETRLDAITVRYVLMVPLQPGVWMMAWKAWLRIDRPAWIAPAVGALTGTYFVCQLLTMPWLSPPVGHSVAAVFKAVIPWLRLGLLALGAFVLVRGAIRRAGDWPLALATALAAAVSIFGSELGQLHAKDIWFPFGVGVSRSEYANATLIVLTTALLTARLSRFAARLRGLEPPACNPQKFSHAQVDARKYS
jgi:hypothetical protein